MYQVPGWAGAVVSDDDAAKARKLHLAEGILVALRRATPEVVIGELVDAARQAGLSPYVLAAGLVAVASGDAAPGVSREVVATARQLWGEPLLGRVGADCNRPGVLGVTGFDS
jgi:hypothetical protein